MGGDKTILLASRGSLDDLQPFLAVGAALKRRGQRAIVAAPSAHAVAVAAAGLEFQPMRPDMPADPEAAGRLMRRVMRPWSGPRLLWRDVVVPAVADACADLTAAAGRLGGVDLMVSHPLTPAVPLVAESLGVPWLSTAMQPLGLFSAADPGRLPGLPGFERLPPALAAAGWRLLDVATGGWSAGLARLRAEMGLPARRGNPLLGGQPSPWGVLGLFSPALRAPRPDDPPRTVVTGFPFHDGAGALPPALEDFLDGGAPPIVFTLGSQAVWMADDFFAVAIAVARDLGRRAVMLVGAGASLGTPPSAGVAVFGDAPHGLLMPRACAVVHHGGIGTTAEALRAGKPMLVVPHGMDQPDNARRCRALGVARVVPRPAFRRAVVAGRLADLLADADAAHAAKILGRRIGAEDGAGRAADAVLAAAGRS